MTKCATCGWEMTFVGQYDITCENPDCPDEDVVFEYGGQDYPVQLADARQETFQWDHSDSHENVLNHSQE